MQNRLLTPELHEALSNYPLYAQETTDIPSIKAVAAFAIGNIRWYICEGNAEGDSYTFYGLVCGMSESPELGYINADELASVSIDASQYGFPSGTVFRVEPVPNFTPCTLSEIKDPDVREYCARHS